jgi:hypothetical protein
MNADVLAFDSTRNPGGGALHPAPKPGPELTALPEREWGLSAAQVVAVVMAIVAVSEVIGLLF